MTQHLPAPVITYHLPHQKRPIGEDDAVWRAPIPVSRDHLIRPEPETATTGICYGDYFKAIHDFVAQSGFRPLHEACSRQVGRHLTTADLKAVRISLEKHGEYYHPGRLAVATTKGDALLVVNLAFSDPGRLMLVTDFMNVERLNHQYPFTFLPEVYQAGQVRLENHPHSLRISLGQWLEGYHEFHLTRASDQAADRMIVWDPQRGNHYLSADQSREVYRQAAMILTAYYNLETTEHISGWHHAAGDFVAAESGSNGQIDLRLITVRKYTRLIPDIPMQTAAVFQALLLFLLNTTIRMRLDRLDGVAEMAWADDRALQGSLAGFFAGLALQVKHGIIPADVPVYFLEYIRKLSAEDAQDLLNSIAARTPSGSPELPLVETHLPRHAASLHRAVRELPNLR